MKRPIAVVASLGLALGIATSAGATDHETMSSGARGAEASAHALQGAVTENRGDVLTIRRHDGQRAQVRIASSTRIRSDRGDVGIADIEIGDHVRVTALDGSHAGGQAGPRVAREIQVREPGVGERGVREPSPGTPPQSPVLLGIPE